METEEPSSSKKTAATSPDANPADEAEDNTESTENDPTEEKDSGRLQREVLQSPRKYSSSEIRTALANLRTVMERATGDEWRSYRRWEESCVKELNYRQKNPPKPAKK